MGWIDFIKVCGFGGFVGEFDVEFYDMVVE